MAQETIALTTSPQQIIALIRALTGHANDDGACTWLTIRANDGNTGSVYEGDAGVSATNYGIELSAADSRTWNNGKGCNDVSLLNKWVRGSASGQSIDIEWEYT